MDRQNEIETRRQEKVDADKDPIAEHVAKDRVVRALAAHQAGIVVVVRELCPLQRARFAWMYSSGGSPFRRFSPEGSGVWHMKHSEGGKSLPSFSAFSLAASAFSSDMLRETWRSL